MRGQTCGSWHKQYIEEFFQAWGEYMGYWSMYLGYENYLISQILIAYTSLGGSSHVSSVVFLADRSRGYQLYSLGQWLNIHQRLDKNQLCYLQAKQVLS